MKTKYSSNDLVCVWVDTIRIVKNDNFLLKICMEWLNYRQPIDEYSLFCSEIVIVHI